MYVRRKLAKVKCFKFIKNYFFIFNHLHAHLQYVCNIPTKYQKDKLNALGDVDFTKKALHAIIQYVHWSKVGLVKIL